MSERPLHKQAADFIRIWMRDKRDGEMGLNTPVSHDGPMKGPRDWYIGMGMIGGLLGLMWSQLSTWGGLIGIAVGVLIVWIVNVVIRVFAGTISRMLGTGEHAKSRKPRGSSVRGDADVKAYYRRKKKDGG